MELPCASKKAYATSWLAGKVATARSKDVSYLRVYHCPDCGMYHLTSREVKECDLPTKVDLRDFIDTKPLVPVALAKSDKHWCRHGEQWLVDVGTVLPDGLNLPKGSLLWLRFRSRNTLAIKITVGVSTYKRSWTIEYFNRTIADRAHPVEGNATCEICGSSGVHVVKENSNESHCGSEVCEAKARHAHQRHR